MAQVPPSLEPEFAPDPAYPTITPPDPVYPCQTLEPLAYPLDGIATPSMWSRLEAPLGRALVVLWEQLGLLARGRPARWATLHCGRIALNAHGWERLQSCLTERPPDPALIAPGEPGLGALPERFEALRVRWKRPSLARRIKLAEVRAHEALAAAARLDPSELDAAELARGPLDVPSWTEVLIPWLEARLLDADALPTARAVAQGIALEQRFGAELGRRLVRRGVVRSPEDVAYLTIEERLRAVHEGSGYWAEHAAARADRVSRFLKVEIPKRFWGRPRPDDPAGELR